MLINGSEPGICYNTSKWIKGQQMYRQIFMEPVALYVFLLSQEGRLHLYSGMYKEDGTLLNKGNLGNYKNAEIRDRRN